jgi:AbrB family looped-hinge helix DNA binding protein
MIPLLLLLASGPRFVDRALERGLDLVVTFGSEEKNYIIERTGTGVGLSDYDGDGDLDVYLVNGSLLELPAGETPPSDRLYRNDGSARFTDVTDEAGLREGGWGAGCLFADFDNDSDPDLFVSNFGPNVLYRNNGDGTFTDVSSAAGVADPRSGSGAAAGDLDSDGFLDLVVANHAVFDRNAPPEQNCFWKGVKVSCGPLSHPPETHLLYRNRGGLTFEDVSLSSGMALKRGYGFGVVLDYFDDDDLLDIYVANDLTENFLFLNRGRFVLEDFGALSGAAYVEGGRPQAGMGVDSGDFDADGRPDLYVTNFSDDYNTLYHNDGAGLFSDVTYRARLGEPSFPYLGWGTRFFDVDHDSDLDLFVVNGHIWPEVDEVASGTWYAQSNQLFLNTGQGTVVEASEEAGLVEKRLGRGAAFGDVDEDGDVDVVIANMHAAPTFLLNETPGKGHFLQLLLVARDSNRDGVGARVSVTTSGRKQVQTAKSGGGYLSSHDPRMHFGLRASRSAEATVRWPSGWTEALGSLQADRVYLVLEGEGVIDSRPPIGKRSSPLALAPTSCGILNGMKTTIDRAGRLVVPKAVRDACGLAPGSEVEIRAVEGRVEIEPAPLEVTLERRGRLVVAVPREPVPKLTVREVNRTLEEVRGSRSRD